MRHFIYSLFFIFALTLHAQQPKKSSATSSKKAVPTKSISSKSTAAKKKQTTGSAPQKAKSTKNTKKQVNSKQSAKKQAAASKNVTNKDIQKLQKEQSNLQQQIKQSENLIKDTKNNVSAQLSNLAVITGSINSQREYIADIESEIDTLTHSIGTLNRDIMILEEDLEECKRKYAHGLMYTYRNRLMQSKLMFIFSAKDFSQMYRRIRYAKEYTKYQRAQGIIIQKKEEKIRQKRDELQQTNIRKTGLLKEGKQQQQELEKQQRERQAVVNELNKKQKQLQATLESQRRQSQLLNSRIDQLIQQEIRRAEERRIAEEARKKAEEARRNAAAQKKAEEERKKAEAERQRREQASKKNRGGKTTEKKQEQETPKPTPAPSTPKYNAPDNTDRRLSSNFAANQGRLPVPITGSYVISAHYGLYSPEGLNGVTLDNKGTNFSGKPGAQARCVFDGEVTSVFNLGGLTNIIVRHGSYISVYCNLSSANVHVGQKVSTRQILGPIARDASGSCTLHFQLRKETSKLNPESWIGR